MHQGLSELEDRGLIGWDREGNRYDLHPVVRGVCWGRLGDSARQDVHERLHEHFEAIPWTKEWHDIESVDDLAAPIELYRSLVGLGRLDDAFVVFRDRLEDATLFRLSASRLRLELLEGLFPKGLDALPGLKTVRDRSYTLNARSASSHKPRRAEAVPNKYKLTPSWNRFPVFLLNTQDSRALASAPYNPPEKRCASDILHKPTARPLSSFSSRSICAASRKSPTALPGEPEY